MSNDDTQRELYEMRAKTLKDKISALNEAERKGIKKGRQEGIKEGEKSKAIEIAKLVWILGKEWPILFLSSIGLRSYFWIGRGLSINILSRTVINKTTNGLINKR